MFPLSHIYVSTKVAKRSNPYLILGSILPDAAWVAREKAINKFGETFRSEVHNSPDKLKSFIDQNFKELADFALGVNLHSSVNKGADIYSDDWSIGFAIKEGREYIERVATILKVADTKKAFVYAHNFIEAATDLCLAEKLPEVLKVYKNSLQGQYSSNVITCLANYLNQSEEVVGKVVSKFLTRFSPESFESPNTLVRNAISPSTTIILGYETDEKAIQALLETCVIKMRGKYLYYLNTAIAQMQISFANAI
ncbi:MAG: hypothetical protein AAB443_01225 [Patescibacteria group bacterium]